MTRAVLVEWKGRPEVDIFWGGESALFEKLAEQKLLQKVEISKAAWDSIPASIGKPKPIPLKDKDGYWIGTALEPYGLVYHPKKIQRLGILSAAPPAIAAELDQKACWEVLTDPVLGEKYFTAEERDLFQRHILWTRILSDRRTVLPDGRPGPLLAGWSGWPRSARR